MNALSSITIQMRSIPVEYSWTSLEFGQWIRENTQKFRIRPMVVLIATDGDYSNRHVFNVTNQTDLPFFVHRRSSQLWIYG